jgi:hypothetical protein
MYIQMSTRPFFQDQEQDFFQDQDFSKRVNQDQDHGLQDQDQDQSDQDKTQTKTLREAKVLKKYFRAKFTHIIRLPFANS